MKKASSLVKTLIGMQESVRFIRYSSVPNNREILINEVLQNSAKWNKRFGDGWGEVGINGRGSFLSILIQLT